MAHIDLNDVSLTFRARPGGRGTLKELAVRLLRCRWRSTAFKVEALRGVNLAIREGERVGIIGHNGAGKSTMLRLLAGVYLPTAGRRTVTGRISSLFDIFLGFEPDGSGWENIRYRAYLQGETPRSLGPKLQAIAEFTELGHFLDMPVRYYSAGMAVRLAFSIATAVEPEILLVDEVLTVGDLAFQAKARQRMHDMMASARLIVMVSHDLDSLAGLCGRCIWLDHGQVRADGPAETVINAYRNSVVGSLAQAA